MLFLAGQSIATYLWLLAVPRLGWAEDVRTNSGSPRRGFSCVVPRQPTNGRWKLHRLYCHENIDCDLPRGFEVPSGSQLVYRCKSGYRIDTDTAVFCTAKGNWSVIPKCIETKCVGLNSVSMTSNCFRFDKWVNCSSPVLPETRAEVSCRPGYRRDTAILSAQGETLRCKRDGNWDPEPIMCVPVCGLRVTRQTPLVAGGSPADVGDFPWHASLYERTVQGNRTWKEFKCGSTLIQANLLLTAAHCVYNETIATMKNPRKYFVVIGNTFRDYNSPLHDPNVVRKAAVKSFHVPCKYKGRRTNYVADIGLIELMEPFELSNILLPACLDVLGYSNQRLEDGVSGRVAGFGKTDTERVSDNLQTLTPPYVSYRECLASLNRSQNTQVRLFDDKFCAGSRNGSSVCHGDSGSGLVLEERDQWYILGIVSSGHLTTGKDSYSKVCNRFAYSYYTKVSIHIPWIFDVIFNLERHGSHPSCSRNVLKSQAITATPRTATDRNIQSSSLRLSCLVPPQPNHGRWRFKSYLCKDHTKCNASQGSSVRPGSQLVYSCDPGYRANGSVNVFCGVNGDWSTIPICIALRCESLNSVSTTASCSLFRKSVNCDLPVPLGTRATISCRHGYRKDTNFAVEQSPNVQCNENGTWEPDPIRCIPACGLVRMDQKPYELNGTTANVTDFPWHASLYEEQSSGNNTRKVFRCGATIIKTNFLLTAAHCLYDEATRTPKHPAKLFVMTGNIFRDYDFPWHDPKIVRQGTVKNVYIHYNFYGLRGNYVSDIALLELHDPFELSNTLLPACLDVDGYDMQILERGSRGRVAGFGRTTQGPTSGILQTIPVPYVLYKQCKTSKLHPDNQVLISTDKFCGGYTDGHGVCGGDSGGGLVFRKDDLWYVMGIVSVGLDVDISGEKICEGYSYTLYTRVSSYMDWIQDVILSPGRYRIPLQ